MVPVEVPTSRLVLRPPRLDDAPAIFARYASVPDVTKFLAWRRHDSVEETRAFVKFSETEWRSRGCGPYLIWSRAGETLLGSTGLQFESAQGAVTGYVLAKDAWGRGYATEALRAVIEVARGEGFQEIAASCHAEHRASARILEKCGFLAAGTLPEQAFPNLSPPRAPALHYRLRLELREAPHE
jgi:RimJ/RimL family protein N-acetyltransferase